MTTRAGYKRIMTGEIIPPVEGQMTLDDFVPSPKATPKATPAPPVQASAITDPRPDLAADTQHWQVLLTLAMAADVKAGRKKLPLLGALHGMRCGGTQLVEAEATPGRLVLRPILDPKTGWASEASYREAAAKYLSPFDRDVKAILKRLAQEPGPEAAESCPWPVE